MSSFSKKTFSASLLLLLFSFYAGAQDTTKEKIIARYDIALSKLDEIIRAPKQTSFKQSVIITENAYLNDLVDSNAVQEKIDKLSTLIELWVRSNSNGKYKYADSTDFLTNYGIFQLMKRHIKVLGLNEKDTLMTRSFEYDFEDFAGRKNWTKMFVATLLITYKGNCHNMPYLYKILADELGAKCWLSFAPNHIYIKNRCQKAGWYNTELTSGEFPIDAWVATSGYVPVDAIRSGIYMDTLSNQQAIAQCVLDLAKGYEALTKDYNDGFILKCCDLTLQYHPVNIQAILLKAETLKHIYEGSTKTSKDVGVYQEMEALYVKLFELGYREMPDKMYMQWLRSVTEQKNKYGNKAVKNILN
jgi:hypothetical protein